MLEFVEDDHLYVLDGVIIPSVSEILHSIFKDKYKNIPSSILNAKAEYGTMVHLSIESYERYLKGDDEYYPCDVNEAYSFVVDDYDLDYIQKESLKQYIKLKKQNDIHVIEQEQMIHYEDKYAGRFDMIARIGTDMCLCDIKTTAELDREYLSWQLSLYEFAYGKRFDKLYAIWLPKKDLGRIVEIERKEESEILKLIEDYENDYPDEERDREREVLGI